MAVIDQINQDLNQALKERDVITVSILRFLLSGIHNAKIAKGGDLTDEEVTGEIGKEAKRHKESIAAYEKTARVDLVDKEKAELEILEKYLPAQLSDEEITKIAKEVIGTLDFGPGDTGRVIGQIMAKVKGRADGAKVSEIVKRLLAAK